MCDTFDPSFVSSPLRLSNGNRKLSYSFPTSSTSLIQKNKTAEEMKSDVKWATVPISVTEQYASQSDGKIHEWAFRVVNDGGSDDASDFIIGLLPVTLWNVPSPVSSSSFSSTSGADQQQQQQQENEENNSNNYDNNTDSHQYKLIRKQFSTDGGFFVSQTNCNLSKVLDRYFDVADLIACLPKSKIMKLIHYHASHKNNLMENWREWSNDKNSAREIDVRTAEDRSVDLVFDYVCDLKARLHDFVNTKGVKENCSSLNKFFFSAFNSSQEFQEFMMQYLHNGVFLDRSVRGRVHRAVSKGNPKQLKNKAALESYVTSVAKEMEEHKKQREQEQQQQQQEEEEDEEDEKRSKTLEELLAPYHLPEPIHTQQQIETITEAIFSQPELDFGIGLTRGGVTRGAARIISTVVRGRTSFSNDDTIFLTLDTKNSRCSIRNGDRFVIFDIEGSGSNSGEGEGDNVVGSGTGMMNASELSVAFAPAVSLCRPTQSIELLYHEIIPKNSISRFTWTRDGALVDDIKLDARAACAYFHSAVEQEQEKEQESQNKKSAISQGETAWKVPPSVQELDTGENNNIQQEIFVAAQRKYPNNDKINSRNQLSQSILDTENFASCVTATNLFSVLKAPGAADHFSFDSPVSSPTINTNNTPLLTDTAARNAVDMILKKCRGIRQQQQQQQNNNEKNNNNNNNIQIKEPRFFDVSFPPTRASINKQVATKNCDSVHSGPVIPNDICQWRRISSFAAEEANIDRVSHLSPRKQLPILDFPELVKESPDCRDVLKSCSKSNHSNVFSENNNNSSSNSNSFDEATIATTEFPATTVISEIASAPLIPDFCHQLFYPSRYNPEGIYSVRFWCPVSKRFFGVIVDDYLPMCDVEFMNSIDEQPYTRFVRSSRRNEYWAALLLKAFAKLYGSYQSLCDSNINFFVSPAAFLRGGANVRRYSPASRTPEELFRTLAYYIDRGDCITACSSTRDPIFGHDTVVAETNGTFRGSSFLILRAIPVGDFKMIELASASSKELWVGSWSHDSTSWRQYPFVANACDIEARGAKLPLELEKIRQTASFWLSASEVSVYFPYLKCISTSGDHVTPSPARRREYELSHRPQNSSSSSENRGFGKQYTSADDNNNNSVTEEGGESPSSSSSYQPNFDIQEPPKNLISQLISPSSNRVPALRDCLSENIQQASAQYISFRETEDENQKPLILGQSGSFFCATCPQMLIKVPVRCAASFLCDFIISKVGGNSKILRKTEIAKDVPNPVFALFKISSSSSGSSSSILQKSKRILFPEHYLPQREIRNTLDQSSPSRYSAIPVTCEKQMKPFMIWNSASFSEEQNLDAGAEYVLVCLVQQAGASSSIDLKMMSSIVLPAWEPLNPVPYRCISGSLVVSSSSQQQHDDDENRTTSTNVQPFLVELVSSGTGDDSVIIECDIGSSSSLLEKNARLRMTVQVSPFVSCESTTTNHQSNNNNNNNSVSRNSGISRGQHITVQGNEHYSTQLSCSIPLPSDEKRYIAVDVVSCEDTENMMNMTNANSSRVLLKEPIVVDVRVTSTKLKRHRLNKFLSSSKNVEGEEDDEEEL